MSTRTLIEINHDQLHRLIDRPDLLKLILEELGASTHNAALNEANARGRSVDIGHGVRIVSQRHHTTEIMVMSKYATVKL